MATPGRWNFSLRLTCLNVRAARDPCARVPLIGTAAVHTEPERPGHHHDRRLTARVEYGLIPDLGLTASVPQARTCEVGAAGTCHVVPLTAVVPGRATATGSGRTGPPSQRLTTSPPFGLRRPGRAATRRASRTSRRPPTHRSSRRSATASI